MKTSSNKRTRTQLFNLFAASILVKLANEFPVEIYYDEKGLGLDCWGEYNLDDESDDLSLTTKIFQGTLKFLVSEGFVNVSHEINNSTNFENLKLCLTVKGLKHLNFKFDSDGKSKKIPLVDALSEALKQPENYYRFMELLTKVFD